MVKQSPRLPVSNVSVNSTSLWSFRVQKEEKEPEKQTGDISTKFPINHWIVL